MCNDHQGQTLDHMSSDPFTCADPSPERIGLACYLLSGATKNSLSLFNWQIKEFLNFILQRIHTEIQRT